MTKLKIYFKHGNEIEYPDVESYTINNQTIEMYFEKHNKIALVPLTNIEEIKVDFEEDRTDEERLIEFYSNFNEVWDEEYDEWWCNL